MSTQATVPRALCTVCREEEVVSIRIGGDPVCEDCVHAGIIPKFVAAWNHEADYPPAWGRYRLHPSSFRAYIKDADEFLALYKNKELEYNTPIAKRLYCQACQTFVCEKDPRCLIRLSCPECKALICEGCGAPDENFTDNTHLCPKPSDAFEGLLRGKDFQVCPIADCGMKVELKDGCNAMRCTSSSCNHQFCFVCGESAEHNSNHWKAGGKCPRFNQPDSQHAHFDRVPQDEQQEADGVIAADQIVAEPQDIPVQQIIAEIDRMDVTDTHEDRAEFERVMRMIKHFVRAAHLPMLGRQETPLGRLAAEANIAAELQAMPLATLMHHQQGQLQALTQVAETMIADHEAQGRDVPAFLPAAIDVFLKLHLNLDMYIWQARLAVGLEHFRRRHGEMARTITVLYSDEMYQHFPMLFRIYLTYFSVFEERVPVALAIREIEANEAGERAALEEAAAALLRLGDGEAGGD